MTSCSDSPCVHTQPCHVVYTDYRPTPLQHYIFPAGGDGLHLVVDENVSESNISFGHLGFKAHCATLCYMEFNKPLLVPTSLAGHGRICHFHSAMSSIY